MIKGAIVFDTCTPKGVLLSIRGYSLFMHNMNRKRYELNSKKCSYSEIQDYL